MKANDQMKELLAAKQESLRRNQAQKSANKLADKQNRWQRFNRFVWDKSRG
ncbi:MAG: hypothetical protein LLG15_11520 [Betaproteobacteria bacterium]|nr:hypothetical protein [Betaproteobacteria bacterium]